MDYQKIPPKYKALLRRLDDPEDNCDDLTYNELNFLRDQWFLDFTYSDDNGLIWRNVKEAGKIFIEDNNNSPDMNKETYAFDVLWRNVLLVDDTLKQIIFIDNILLEDEYNTEKTYQILNLDEKKLQEVLKKTQEIDLFKPHLVNDLYELFFIYRAFFLRIYLQYEKWTRNKNIIKWIHDKANTDRLQKHLGEDFMSDILSRNLWWLTLISQKFHNMIIQNKPKNIPKTIHVENNFGNIAWTNSGYQEVNNGIKNTYKNSKSWQDNIWIYLFVSIILIVVWFLIEYYFFK